MNDSQKTVKDLTLYKERISVRSDTEEDKVLGKEAPDKMKQSTLDADTSPVARFLGWSIVTLIRKERCIPCIQLRTFNIDNRSRVLDPAGLRRGNTQFIGLTIVD
ncbi:hypothetical protein K491DRAFT_685503 [Lophiostoma macrostomum CBS 122681]|uniref:Uncharacterized protein n=1 Tax=Lophiostoma macrostomum CBS 122681 TaxID=1314788 RepID=A0A6A6SKD9_9PLEO|nr:hypothetical protein K491DRAFT_685503 [Lophiostoma macrostomum CBS 122681]